MLLYAAADQRYMSKISGPLMDRIDIQIDVPAVPYKELSNARAAESSETIRMRVIAARNIQLRRFFDEKIYTNAQMGPRHLRKHCVLTSECEKIMENAVTKLGFSARGYDRILKVAVLLRTLPAKTHCRQNIFRRLSNTERWIETYGHEEGKPCGETLQGHKL
jgi:magnesium chelatase family protein